MLRLGFTLFRIAVVLFILGAAAAIIVGAAFWISRKAPEAQLALVALILGVNFGGIAGMSAAMKAIGDLERRVNARAYLEEVNRRARADLILLAILSLSVSACSLEAIAGAPVPRRPWCNVKVASAGNVDNPTQELGAIYRAEPCEAWHTDTIGWVLP